MKYKNGEEFLNSLYSNMHMEEVVMHTAEKSDSPTKKISTYIERLEEVHDIVKDSSHKMEIFKRFCYDKYVIKELPENYINLQKRIARERAMGDVEVTEQVKAELLSNVQKEQEKSLDMWIDYLTSDDAMYPLWFKYYTFRGMLKLNNFDKEKGKFGRRSKTTTKPYVELNREVLARVYDTLAKEIGTNEEICEEVSKALENGESFKKLYEYYLRTTGFVNRSEDTEGIWVKYDQESGYRPLWESLQGKNTGWSTAGEKTAKLQLSNGDFYVYYTKDKEGKYKEPRIAIKMNGKNKIEEIRGVGEHQNLEGCMTSIVEKKLNEFFDKGKYLKKVNDMKLLTEIDKKVNNNIELTKEELRFLYEIDNKIAGFGYNEDPRIKEIRDRRNHKKDLAFVFDCKEENIGTKLSDFENNNIICFYGDLKYKGETLTDNFRSLQSIVGNADFKNLTSAEGLESLQSIGGNADFKNLTSARGLESLQSIGGSTRFTKLTSGEGLESLQSIGGDADFKNLTSARGLESLQSIAGSARFIKLTSARGLGSLRNIGGDALFCNLTSARDLGSLRNIGGDAWFYNLTSARGLESLQSIGRYACFRNLTSARGLESLQNIGGDACFRNLTSAEGLENLQSIGRVAFFNNLTSARGLESLRSIGGDAWFTKLTSAEGLGSLQSIGRDAWFHDLTSARGLGSLRSIGRDALFYNLTSAEGLGSLQSIGKNAWFANLTSARGLGSLQSIGMDARFDNLTSAEGLGSLRSIGRDAWFHDLTSARGLGSLQSIRRHACFDNLTSAVGLGSLQSIGGDARFNKLTSARGLESLQSIRRDAWFENLTSAVGLESLQRIGGCAWFNKLTSARGLENLQSVGRRAYFENLASTQGLENFKTMFGVDTTKFKEEINSRVSKINIRK